MNPIAQLLTPSRIAIDVEVDSKARLFEEAGVLFERSAGLSRTVVSASLAAREKLGSTGLGQGIAIPHGRIKGLAKATGAFLRLATPIAFEAPDGKPVQQLFVLLVPEHATEEHLQLLSELAQMFSQRPFRGQLAAAMSAEDLIELFRAWQAA
ncbi:MAG TPA: PTS IIA-like nitrogen regulatory protein PtsN [Casimicrobiaceae bacterium]|jgi:PTS system nitrogen regulatory IIA component